MQLGSKISNIFVVLYLLATLWLRFVLEPQLQGHILASVGLGLFALLILWALIKSRILNPTLLHLGNRRKTT